MACAICNISLGVPLANLKLAMRCLKEVAMGVLTSEEGALAGPYFDQLISRPF